ncbi:MAG: nucleotidyltransferase family protein, partial [Candidatus Omnitrophica bacterium]|nr:nucleotidyltransferase family protein [Candidatus Omnitrophota bacterium]
ERYGVSKIGVFGSYGRNEATEESDIDLLVEFDRPIGLLKFIELEGQLGELLGGKVDLVTQAALKPHIGKRILDEVAMV